MRAEATTVLKPNRIQPKLGTVLILLHMNVRWLAPIGRIEEQPIRAGRTGFLL
jgi:hypothetical protein